MPCGLFFRYIRTRLEARKRRREERLNGQNDLNSSKEASKRTSTSESDKARASILSQWLSGLRAEISPRISHSHIQTNSQVHSQSHSGPNRECQNLRGRPCLTRFRHNPNPCKNHQKSLLIRQSHTSRDFRASLDSKLSTTFALTRPASSMTRRRWRSQTAQAWSIFVCQCMFMDLACGDPLTHLG